jgi:diguanylate cyclase (GGDEF)-like protein/PAS domain S-box-containing protein
VLRSLSPVHIEYLRNMGVRASMSISLLQNGRLWGLIACHHTEPKQVSNAVQEAASFLSQIVSSKLSLLEVHEWRNLGMDASRIIGALLKNITMDTEEAIYQHLLPDLLNLLDATGVIMAVEGRRYVYGDLPSHADVDALNAWLSTQSAFDSLSCNHLGERFSPADGYADVASGLLATPLSVDMNNCIIWLRKEKLRTVHWAGRPEKIFHEDEAGVRLSPRKSFETWQETWRGRSEPWSHIEIETAKSIALALTQGLAQKAQLELAQAEKKRADEALREVGQYRAFFENSPIAVHLVNIVSQSVMLANQRFAELTGYDMADMAGADPKKYYFHPQDYDVLVAESLSGRPVANVLVQIRVRGSCEGGPWVLASCQQLRYQNEAAVLVWFYDISELKRAEEALLITASVFANIQEAVLIADANGTIIDVNPAFSTITGYARDEAIGKKPRMLSSGRHNKEFYAAMWGALNSQKSWRGEIWNKRKSGEHYAEMLSISVVQDHEGKVLRYVAVFSDITHLKVHEAELRRIAHYDALTGIPNRALLVDRMRQAIAQTLREKNMLAVCYLDLDGFKQINDTLGHEAGDQVLIDTATRIGHAIRGGDTVARLGGDEFVVLLPGLNHVEECVPTLERLLVEIATPIVINGKPRGISASIGVCVLTRDNETPDALLNRSDQAMYKAKQSGKNRYWICGVNGEQGRN